MSVRVPLGTYTGRPQFYEYDPEEKCFLCRKFLSGPAIVEWSGLYDLYLHPECALDLMVALGRDVSEIKRSHGLRPDMRPLQERA
jgi:hypothetical protein